MRVGRRDWAKVDYEMRMTSGRDLSTYFRMDKLLTASLGIREDCIHQARILDVGCGPISIVPNRHKNEPVAVVGIDPLAEKYQQLLARHDIPSRIAMLPLRAEDLLTAQLPFDNYHIVHSRNALDHAEDAPAAIKACASRVCSCGYLVLIHHENEGKRVEYNGLHQWNFVVTEDGLRIEDANGSGDLLLDLMSEVGNFELARDISRAPSVIPTVQIDWIVSVFRRVG